MRMKYKSMEKSAMDQYIKDADMRLATSDRIGDVYVSRDGEKLLKIHREYEIDGKKYVYYNDNYNVTLNNAGYCQTGISKCVLIHRLVATAFVPNPNGYEEIDHIDGNKQNNHADNLEWVTRKENMRRARENHQIDYALMAQTTRERGRYVKGAYHVDGKTIPMTFDEYLEMRVEKGWPIQKLIYNRERGAANRERTGQTESNGD